MEESGTDINEKGLRGFRGGSGLVKSVKREEAVLWVHVTFSSGAKVLEERLSFFHCCWFTLLAVSVVDLNCEVMLMAYVLRLGWLLVDML